MRVKALIVTTLIASFFHGILQARTADMTDSGQCSLNNGVFGAQYTGIASGASALYGKAWSDQGSTRAVFGENNSNAGIGVYGLARSAVDRNYGVVGIARGLSGRGVYGWATSAQDGPTIGVYGRSASGLGRGVLGLATNDSDQATWGVYGESHSKQNARGVQGVAAASSADSGTNNYGVYGVNRSPWGRGVYGRSTNDSGRNVGVYGRSDSVEGRGVVGVATAATGQTYGLIGASYGSEGRGVYGWASSTSSSDFTYGVFGRVDTTTKGAGVRGLAAADRGRAYGVIGESRSRDGVGVYGWVRSEGGRTFGVVGDTASAIGVGVAGYHLPTSGVGYAVYGRSESPVGWAVYADGNVYVRGNLESRGSKSAVADLGNGEGVRFYAEEASENWFADYGVARLEKGTAVVEIDPIFAQAVNTKGEYHVFLTPREDCNGLYVIEQREVSFEVKELQGGQSDVAFSYRILARRKGYESERLARVSKEQMQSPGLRTRFAETQDTTHRITIAHGATNP